MRHTEQGDTPLADPSSACHEEAQHHSLPPCPRQAEEEEQWRMAGGVEDLGDDELPPAIGVAVLFFYFFDAGRMVW